MNALLLGFLLFANWLTFDGKGKHVVLVTGDEEYRSEEAMPQLASILSKHHGFKTTVLFAIDPKDGTVNPERTNNIPGLEALKTADLLILFIRWRDLPDDQMKYIIDYVESGKPVIGIRTATHPFASKSSKTYERWNWNNKDFDGGFGRQVLGETWVAHHGKHKIQSTRARIVPGQEKNPILRGIKDGEIWVRTDVYTVKNPLPGDSVPLLAGEVLEGMQPSDKPVAGPQNEPKLPVAWTKTYKGAPVFTTTMGSSQDLENEGFRRLLANATYWALGMEVPAKANVDFVGPYSPTPFGFGGQAKGKKPEDFVARNYQPTWESVDQRPNPQWFSDAKFGIFIHWGVYSVPAFAPVGKYAEWYWNALSKGPTDNGKPNPTYNFHKRVYGEKFPYANFAPMFKAELYDPAHWADVFQKSGARYVVLTSKHHDGFALWPSEHANKAWSRPWNAASTGPKRDILGDLTNEVRKRDLKMGFYYSLYEWYNPLWQSNRKKYVGEHMIPQFKDLVTRYKPSLIFSDGEWDMPGEDWQSPALLAWLYNESPSRTDVIVNDRWGKGSRHKHGGYWTTEYTAGLDSGGHAWEENRGMGFSYGYNRAETLKDYRTERELILMLADLVSRGGNLLLDIGPTGDGRIPEVMEERLTQIGKWLKTNGEAIYGTRPAKLTRQWSAGEQPKLETGEFMTRYEVTDYVERKKPGQAIIEAFFTSKGDDLYAIVPGIPGERFVLKNASLKRGASTELLGHPGALTMNPSGSDLVIQLPRPDAALASQPAYVLRFRGLQTHF